jgi:F0F1-type ATP synthase beta subunit
MIDVIDLIVKECDEVARLLVRKNKAYGNSFAEPLHVFSKLTPEQGIRVRLDDKLKRIANGTNLDDVPEDTEEDLLGYLILLRVLRKIKILEEELAR